MKKSIVMVSICLLSTVYAAAEGYQVNSQSTKQGAMGHVGTAMKLGAESMHFNPAGLAFMDKTIDLSAGVFGIFSNVEYSNATGYKHEADNKASTPLYFYGGFKIYDNLAAGVSVTNPYGSAMNWGVNWAGSGLIQDISLKAFSIQPTVSWKIMDRLSIGAGLQLVFGDFALSRALLPAGALNGLSALGNAQVNAIVDKYKDMAAASVTLAGDAGLKFGFNVGAMFDISEQFTVGVSYRSKIEMEVPEGKAEMNYVNETELKGMLDMVNPYLGDNAIVIPPLDKGTFSAALPLPSNFCVGLNYKPTARWQVSGEVQFVGWGAYKDLNVQFTQEALGDYYSLKAKKDYKNTRIYRLGAQFAATQRFDLRLGAYVDESPVKTDYLNPETPSMTKLGMTAGFSFRPLDNWSVDLGLAYITGFGRDGSYPISENPKQEFAGHYEVSAINASIGLSYSF
ncbi:outer membrane protein transport protein [Parabacteroides sp. OttesenSCG-928-N08]|nr:outer membrane protein transport protein [Parabacteroides sp. OttesenSCG-928-N08]